MKTPPSGEAHRTKMGDMHAGHAAEGLIDPTDSWGTLGAHVVAARGSPGAREVIVVSWKDN